MSEVAIQARDLRKTFASPRGAIHAVEGLSMEVHMGELFGLIGPNGAGKSTTVGMLTTRVQPTGGVALVAGADVSQDPVEVKRRIGVVTQHNTLDRSLTVSENLEFRGRYAGMSARAARTRAAELLTMFNLSDRADSAVHELSGGQAQRVLIARALAHYPQILFLDEPTSGLDPQTRVNLWELLRAMHSEGQTILLTTHYLEEAEALCDRVGIVDHGRLLACDSVAKLKDSSTSDTILTLHFGSDCTALAWASGMHVAEVIAASRDVPPDEVIAEGNIMRIRTAHPERVLSKLIPAADQMGLDLIDIQILRPSLESVFLALTGREYRE